MMTFNECTRNVPCIDCDNVKCIFQGKKESDCPKYHCDRPDKLKHDCEHCQFIDDFIEDMRKEDSHYGRKVTKEDIFAWVME